VPGDVNATAATKGKLAAANRPGGERAPRDAVDAHRRRRFSVLILGEVIEIAAGRIAGEVQDVTGSSSIDQRLRLYATVGERHEAHRGR
jgi:hypothetical protein